MKAWTTAILLILALVPGAALADGKTKIWSDVDTDGVGASILCDIGQPGSWSVGPMVTWEDNKDLDSDDLWSLGIQWEMQVDPNATIAVADWIGAIGTTLGLPETMAARTYVVGEGKVVNPFEGELHSVLSVGPGVAVGPLYLEYVYQLAEGGVIESLDIESGPVLRFGVVPIEF